MTGNQTSASISAGRILLLEGTLDQNMNAVVVTLKRHGFEVTVVPDGEAALSQMSSDLPDILIISDKTTGAVSAEFVSLLRRDPRLLDLPVLVLVTPVRPREGLVGLKIGQEQEIQIEKPVHPQEILAIVKRFVGRP